MNTDPYPRDAQNRARLRDVGVVCVLCGLVGLFSSPPTHHRAIFDDRIYLASGIVMLAGIALLALWAILATRSAWRNRRERNRRGFEVLSSQHDKSQDGPSGPT
jgi:hypothetical protein